MIRNLGYRRFNKLIQSFNSVENLFNASFSQILKVDGIGEKLANQISSEEIKKDVKRHIEYMKRNNIDIVFINDDFYPNDLKQIYDPPICIYVRGNKEILNKKSIAIVGCRDASEYGKKVAQDFAFNISKNDFNIVSGLARGIDSFAHLGAVKAKEKTIAVLGNGLDTIYPKENTKLAKEILNLGGVILSEYSLGSPPKKQNFPARNRIISGISKGLIVIEAKEKSGTMITVECALEQGRDVFAIPGNIDSLNSIGTNEIIKQGAKLVTKWEEIVEEYK